MSKLNNEKKSNSGAILLVLFLLAAGAGVFWADANYMPRFKDEFARLERERIITSNKLATAKIVHEGLNHVRDLIFSNMDFPGQPDTIDHESQFFEFITTCINDLRLKLVSVRPITPVVNDRVTIYGYDVEIEGDFFKFGELSAKFENNRRLVSIENFSVNQIQGREGEGRAANDLVSTAHRDIRVTMRVNTYRIRK
jgi:hypothetical protein